MERLAEIKKLEIQNTLQISAPSQPPITVVPTVLEPARLIKPKASKKSDG
jgi:hypothetical protein